MQRDVWVKNGILGRNGHAKGLLGENWCAKGLLGLKWGLGGIGVQRDFRVKLGF